MSGRTTTRLVGLGSGAVGVGMLAFGNRLAGRLIRHSVEGRVELGVQALGARHVAQGFLCLVAPASSPARWTWLVDLLHVASMAAAAIRPSRLRPLYLASCGLGSLMLAGDLRARSARSRTQTARGDDRA